ncbi:MAG: ribbon-helix-helix protein, CopG family [Candidatus Rokubacteria bacterium]|nr:ribbon-helix-helix protein, CopG family [Candidatus Rokubacteria bacterium]
MHRRINITLPEETARLIDGIAARGDRSRLIAEAVAHYVRARGRARLRKQLREGASRRAERDLRLTQEWFSLDEEAWGRRGR